MKFRIIVFCMLFGLTKSTTGQNVLTLDVKSLTDTSKITLKDGARQLALSDSLPFKDTVWILRVMTNNNPFKVKVQSNSAPIGITELNTLSSSKDYSVQNNNIDNRLSLGNSIGISVLKDDGSVVKNYSKIRYFKKGVDITQISSNSNSSNTDKYKVGSMIFDALFLADSTSDLNTKLKILGYYASLKENTLFDEIKLKLQGNKFLEFYLDELLTQAKRNNVTIQQNGGILSLFSGGSLGGLDVTNIADGFAKFIVKRTKKELNIAFFDKFKEFIGKYPDLQTVFPQTYRALSIIGDEIYNYESYIQTLRESFENDLATLDKNLPSIIKNHPVFFNEHPALAAMLNSGCYIAGGLDDKIHPGDILKDYPSAYLDSLNINWKGAIQTLQIVSASLRDTATNTDSVYWVNPKQVKKLIATPGAFKIYLGLLYEEAKKENENQGIHFTYKREDTTLTGIINWLAGHQQYIGSYQDFITQFIDKADKLNKMIKNYKKADNDSLAFEQYYNYFNSSVNLLQHCTEISKLPGIKDKIPDLQDSLKDYFDVAHSAADLVLDIKRRNYASAIVNSVHIYELVKAKYTTKNHLLSARQQKKVDKDLHDKVNDLIEKAGKNSTASITGYQIESEKAAVVNKQQQAGLSEKEKKKMNKELAADLIRKASIDPSFTLDSAQLESMRKEKFTTVTQKDDTLKKLYKYGTFMAAMVQAKSSDDIEKVIESFALPTGSARIKRVSDFNVSINSYAGLFYGFERINSVDSGKWQANTYGVTAPIGVAASWGHRLFFIPTGKREWSTSIFVSLVDLGAVAAFRFRDDSTAQVPTIQLKDIFSPGAFLSIGIPKTPLSVNLGTQMGPNLRKINKTDPANLKNDYGNKIYWRYSISVCVDIPLLNLYTKSK